MTVTNDCVYVGVNDRAITLFEGQYPVAHGMTYNSYVILDSDIAVMDTVDKAFGEEWMTRVESVLQGRDPSYLIVQHMEPDHSSNIARFMASYPRAVVVASAKAFDMMKTFYGDAYESRCIVIKEGDTLSLGRHQLHFVAAPMVHWPEVMVTYDAADKVLFSADGFGMFGALDAPQEWDDEARRYYIGIVGKYGTRVQALLKKAAALDIETVAPLHGPVLKGEAITRALELYQLWSTYEPEEHGTVLAYTSVYGNTEEAVKELASKLDCKTVLYDLARTDMTQAVADAFRYDTLVLATTTYNADVFPFMATFLKHLTGRNFQNRTVAFIENGSWAPMAAKKMREALDSCPKLRFAEQIVTLRSALDDASHAQIDILAKELNEK